MGLRMISLKCSVSATTSPLTSRPEAIAAIRLDDADMISDMHGSAAYRAQLAGVVARRAVADCLR